MFMSTTIQTFTRSTAHQRHQQTPLMIRIDRQVVTALQVFHRSRHPLYRHHPCRRYHQSQITSPHISSHQTAPSLLQRDAVDRIHQMKQTYQLCHLARSHIPRSRTNTLRVNALDLRSEVLRQLCLQLVQSCAQA